MTVHEITVNQKLSLKTYYKTRDGVQRIEQGLEFLQVVRCYHPPIQSYRTRGILWTCPITKVSLNDLTDLSKSHWIYTQNVGFGVRATYRDGGTVNDLDAYTAIVRFPFFPDAGNTPYIFNHNLFHSDSFHTAHRFSTVALEDFLAVLDQLCDDVGLSYTPFKLYYGDGPTKYVIPSGFQRMYNNSIVQNTEATSTLHGYPINVKELYKQIHDRLQLYYRHIGYTGYENAKYIGNYITIKTSGSGNTGGFEEHGSYESPLRVIQFKLPINGAITSVVRTDIKPDVKRKFYYDRKPLDTDKLGESGHISITSIAPLLHRSTAVPTGTCFPWQFVYSEASEYSPYLIGSSGPDNVSRTERKTNPLSPSFTVDVIADVNFTNTAFSSAPPPNTRDGISGDPQTTSKIILGNSSYYSAVAGPPVPYSPLVNVPGNCYISRHSTTGVGYCIHLAGRTLRQMSGIRINGDSRVKLTRKLYGPFIDFSGNNLGPIGFSAAINTVTCRAVFITDKTFFPKQVPFVEPTVGLTLRSGTVLGTGTPGGYLTVSESTINGLLDTPAYGLFIAFTIDDFILDADAFDNVKGLCDFLTGNGRNILGYDWFGGLGGGLGAIASMAEAIEITPDDTPNPTNAAEFRIGPFAIRSYGAFHEQ